MKGCRGCLFGVLCVLSVLAFAFAVLFVRRQTRIREREKERAETEALIRAHTDNAPLRTSTDGSPSSARTSQIPPRPRDRPPSKPRVRVSPWRRSGCNGCSNGFTPCSPPRTARSRTRTCRISSRRSKASVEPRVQNCSGPFAGESVGGKF